MKQTSTATCRLLCFVYLCFSAGAFQGLQLPVLDSNPGQSLSLCANKQDGRQLIKLEKSRRVFFRSSLVVGLSTWKPLLVEPCLALSPNEAKLAYDEYASSYDELDGGQAASFLGIEQARASLLGQAQGNILEVGVGTGLNLDKYDAKLIKSLTLVDISEGMLSEAGRRLSSLPQLRDVPVKLIQADATSQLVHMFGTNSFDTVVDTFSLCVFGNDGAKDSLDQMRQVVKKESDGGKVLLLENSRSSNALLGMYQDVTAEAAASMGGKGCVYNQDVASLIKASGMQVTQVGNYAAGLFRSFTCTTP